MFFIVGLEFMGFAQKTILQSVIPVLFELCFIAPVIKGAAEAPVEGSFVDDDGVFDIVA